MTSLRSERGPDTGARHSGPALPDRVESQTGPNRGGTHPDFLAGERDRKRAEQRLTAQHAVASVLAESVSLPEATPRILQAVCESLGWELGALWKVDVNAGKLRCVALWHQRARPVPEFCAATQEAVFGCGAGFPGRIWAEAKPVWVENVAEDARCPRASIADREGLHAAFGFPITIQHEVVGVIEFFSNEIQRPDEDLVRMMATIGSQLGQFIVRKQMEESLAAERNLLRTLIDTLPDAIYVKDTGSRFVLANLGVAQLMGAARPEDLYGRKDSDFYPPDLARQYFADEQALVKSGRPLINHEEPVINPRGEQRWLLTTKAPLRDGRGCVTGLVGIGRDITERKRAEGELKNACAELARREEELRTALTELKASHEELKTTQSQLIQSEKLESIGTLAAGVAHEVRNPLQTVLAGVDFLCVHAARRRETVPMVLTEMRDAIRRADVIVRELLEFSAANHPDVRDEDLNAIARHSLSLMQYELKKHHITLAVELAADLPTLKLERNKIQQVFINLFLNAVQSMPEGGTLTVRTYAQPPAGERPTESGGAPGQWKPEETIVVVEIEDTGAGIPPGQLTKIFDPFFTTKPTGAGTGLGLPITKKIIELHGAAMRIGNREQGGVRVSIVFPANGEKNHEQKTNPDH